MKKKMMLIFGLLFAILSVMAQDLKPVKLVAPDTLGGIPVMKAFALRASQSDYDTAPLALQDLSNLLWAANGINRPASGKRTAPSAMNAQDVDIYVFMAKGAWLYDARQNQLNPVVAGDYRNLIAGRQVNFATAPVMLLLVSDISKFRAGDDSLKRVWAAEDAGIVSQNIALFCAGMGFATRPRASMEQEKLREILGLKETQHMLLNHPVSYMKK